MLDPLAGAEGPPVEVKGAGDGHPGGRGHEDLFDPGLGPPGRVTQGGVVDRHHPPPEDGQALLLGHRRQLAAGLGGGVGVLGEKSEPGGVPPRLGEGEAGVVGHVGQQAVRHLDQDARPVTGGHLCPRGPPVGQPLEHGQRLADQMVALSTLEVGHEADTAGVVLVRRVVEAAGGWGAARVRMGHGRPLGS